MQGTEIDVNVIGVRKLGRNIIWEVDKLNKLHSTLEFQKELLPAKVDCRPHVIRLGPVSYTHLGVYKRQHQPPRFS